MKCVGTLLIYGCLIAQVSIGWATPPDNLLAEWKFDEGQGDIAHDSSSSSLHGKIVGATWVKHHGGYALRFDGVSSMVECEENPTLSLMGPLTLEAWVKPTSVGWGECFLIGRSSQEYMLNHSNRGLAVWLLATGNYNVAGKLFLGKWNHVAASFDGKRRKLWINGQLVGEAESQAPPGRPGVFRMGSASGPCFNGLLDDVRVYGRSLSEEEVVAHYRGEAGNYGIDVDLFQNIKVTPYFYFDRGSLVVEVDYRGLQPLQSNSRIEVSLSNLEQKSESIAHSLIESLPKSGVVEAELACDKLQTGKYLIRATLADDKQTRSSKEIPFEYPRNPSIPDPSKKVATALKPLAQPAPFDLNVPKGGGLTLTINGVRYPFDSRISWPNGEFNSLTASERASSTGEKSWSVAVHRRGKNRYEVAASGDFYEIRRHVEVFPNHIAVHDTYANKTNEDLGLLIYNELPLKDKTLTASRLAGYEGGGRLVDALSPHHGGPSVFIQDGNAGIGMLPIDDVYVLQSVLYIDKNRAGMGTERLALPPHGSYTLEWAIYPHGASASGSPGDYYDFINAFRKTEGRIGTVEDAPSFIAYGPMNHRQVPDSDFINFRGVRCGIINCLSRTADDPGISIEGFEFIDFPKERQLIKQQTAAIHKRHPDMKVVFHIAHTLYATNQPDRFADSRIIREDGNHAASGGPPFFSKQRSDEGWAWYVYYPTPGNSFHEAMMKSIDVMMDEMGVDGAFVDGFLLGYGGRWTYDRWDGHSAEIDPQTKTIKRKIGSVLLLMQPSMIEYARKIRDKGGIVIANGSVITRSIANEKYIIFDAECQAGPECHLAPSALSLSLPPFDTEKEIYLDVLDKLRWGVLYMYFNERIKLTHPSLPSKQFPITFEEMRSGIVRGKERIITMNSDVYGWPGDSSLHAVHRFDGRGAPTTNRFITTVDRDNVRTELNFDEHESAVIERIPATLEAATPVNVLLTHYDGYGLQALLNGHGDATLRMFVGTSYPDRRDGVFIDGGLNPAVADVGDAYRVTVNGVVSTIEERDGVLAIPLKLDGQSEFSVQRAIRNSQ